ncbi:MAG: VOC family protein [Pseudomonadota bacterium]
MRFINPIPFVADIERARRFYTEIMGLTPLEDHGNFVKFEAGFAIHDGRSLERTIWGSEAKANNGYGAGNLLLYFEHDDIDAAFAAIAPQVQLIHPIERQDWNQRVFRFYDPDGHVIEIGEPQDTDRD